MKKFCRENKNEYDKFLQREHDEKNILKESTELSNENDKHILTEQTENDTFDDLSLNILEEPHSPVFVGISIGNCFPPNNGMALLCNAGEKVQKRSKKKNIYPKIIQCDDACKLISTDNRKYAKKGNILYEQVCKTCNNRLINCFGGLKKVHYCQFFPDFCSYAECSSCFDFQNITTKRKRIILNTI